MQGEVAVDLVIVEDAVEVVLGGWRDGAALYVLAHDCEGNMPGFSSCCIYRCKIV